MIPNACFTTELPPFLMMYDGNKSLDIPLQKKPGHFRHSGECRRTTPKIDTLQKCILYIRINNIILTLIMIDTILLLGVTRK